MKRILASLFFSLTLLIFSTAQDLAEYVNPLLINHSLEEDKSVPSSPNWLREGVWHIGLRGGVAWSKILDIENTIVSPIYSRDSYERDTSFRKPPRFVGGVFFHKKWMTNSGNWALAVQPEVNLAMQGGQFHYEDDFGLSYDIDFKYNYFLFSPMLKLYHKSGVHIMVGPQLELAINRSNLDYSSNYNDVNNDTPVLGVDLQIQENLRQTLQAEHNFSIPVGLGYEYMFSNGLGLMLEGRYSWGFVDLIETGPNGYFMEENPSERSRSWQLTLGISKLL